MAVQMLGIKTKFTDDQGRPLVGGKVHAYFAGTTTYQDTFKDPDMTIVNTNPIILDDSGSADVYLNGSYRIRIFDKNDVLIEEQDGVTQSASGEITTAKGEVIGLYGAVLNSLTNEVKRAIAAEKTIADSLTSETTRAKAAESALQSSIDAEAVRAKAAESDLNADIIKEVSDRESEVTRLDEADAVLQAQINSVGGGKLAYKTYAEMIADESNIAAKSSIDIIADTDDKNGTYLYDGTDFVKSQYDLEKIVRAKVQNTFDTYAQMVASNLSDGSYALVADDTAGNNGIYIKTAGSWVKSKYNPSKHKLVSNSEDLNNLVTEGIYSLPTSGNISLDNNYPFKTGGILVVDTSGTYYKQHIFTNTGIASRWRSSSAIWSNWSGIAHSGSRIVDLAELVTLKSAVTQLQGASDSLENSLDSIQPKIIISMDNPDMGGHLDNAFKVGTYIINSSGLSSTGNGFPIGGSSGKLEVTRNAANIIFQLWQSQGGVCYRWGIYRNDEEGERVEWRNWSGVKFTGSSIVDLAGIQSDIQSLKDSSGSLGSIITYGSSTLRGLVSGGLRDWADSKGLVLHDRAIGGDVIGGVGQAQGSNIVTAKFLTGTISASGESTAMLESSFEALPRQDRSVALSNGVKGEMTPLGIFTASNLSVDMEVDPTVEFRVTEPNWYKKEASLYIVNIGKNDISPTGKDTQWLFDRTVDILEYLPKKSDFVVVGHFADYYSSVDKVQKIKDLNNLLRKHYGLKYIDLYEILYDDAVWSELGIEKTADDIQAISKEWLPKSLASDAGSHLKLELQPIVSRVITDRIEMLGYV